MCADVLLLAFGGVRWPKYAACIRHYGALGEGPATHRLQMTMDVASYIVFGIGTVFLAFAGLHGFESKSVTIVSFGIGATMLVIAGCLYWQDAVWKRDAASRSISPAVLRAKLEDQVNKPSSRNGLV